MAGFAIEAWGAPPLGGSRDCNPGGFESRINGLRRAQGAVSGPFRGPFCAPVGGHRPRLTGPVAFDIVVFMQEKICRMMRMPDFPKGEGAIA